MQFIIRALYEDQPFASGILTILKACCHLKMQI